MATLYVDLSHHDWNRTKGELDWADIRRATSNVVCLRATYGDPAGYNPPSPHFVEMASGARAAGFNTIGGYHNLITGSENSINRQVDYLRSTLDSAGATWAMLDIERYPELLNAGLQPRFADVRRFVTRWKTVDERVLTIYLPRWIWDGHMGRPDLRPLNCPLVASDYGNNPDDTPAWVYAARGGDTGRGWLGYGGITPAIWQYGSNVNCPGASGQTDANAFRGTESQLHALLTGSDSGAGEDTFMEALSAAEQQAMRDQIHVLAVEWRHYRLLWNAVAGKNHPTGQDTPLPVVDAIAAIGAVADGVDALITKVNAIAATQPGAITDEQLERVLRKVLGMSPGSATL